MSSSLCLLFLLDCKVEPHKKELHVTLAYQFAANAFPALEKMAKQLDLNAAARWELRLYSRDPRAAKSEVKSILNAIYDKSQWQRPNWTVVNLSLIGTHTLTVPVNTHTLYKKPVYWLMTVASSGQMQYCCCMMNYFFKIGQLEQLTGRHCQWGIHSMSRLKST